MTIYLNKKILKENIKTSLFPSFSFPFSRLVELLASSVLGWFRA